jgi:hypothetical protein
MDDIGVGIPLAMELPVDGEMFEAALERARITRGEGLRYARREIAKERDATLIVVLTLLKVLVIPQTEEFLASGELEGIKIECGPGCSSCCHQNVEVSIPEAILVSLQVADPVDPRRAAILETADAIVGMDPQKRVVCGGPCPLLVDNKCSVYESRPLQCRATLSPCAQGCRDALQGKNSAQVYPAPQLFAQADKDALRGICKDMSLQYDNVDLVQTVAAILRDPTKVVRWAMGEHVFTPLPRVPLVPQTFEVAS